MIKTFGDLFAIRGLQNFKFNEFCNNEIHFVCQISSQRGRETEGKMEREKDREEKTEREEETEGQRKRQKKSKNW